MNRLLAAIAAFAAVLMAGAIFMQRRAIDELRGEIAELRAEIGPMAKGRADATRASRPQVDHATAVESGAASGQPTEIAQLRAELKALTATTQQAVQQAQAAVQAARGESPIPVELVPSSEWKNAGRATVGAAVETVLWAAAGGDVDVLKNSILLNDAARAKAEALLARLPDAARAEYGSPENLIALLLAKDAATATGMQILGQRDVSADVVGVRVRVGTEDGKTSEQGLGFRRTSDGLRLIITDTFVDRYARQLAGRK